MSEGSIHTWELNLDYQRCPDCGWIQECRLPYVYDKGHYKKDLVCERCQHAWSVTKGGKIHLGPLIGKPQPAEIDWENWHG